MTTPADLPATPDTTTTTPDPGPVASDFDPFAAATTSPDASPAPTEGGAADAPAEDGPDKGSSWYSPPDVALPGEDGSPQVPEGMDGDAQAAAQQVQDRMDAETEQGYFGAVPDPTPNENYTVAGVTSGKPTPETDPDLARQAGNRGRFA